MFLSNARTPNNHVIPSKGRRTTVPLIASLNEQKRDTNKAKLRSSAWMLVSLCPCRWRTKIETQPQLRHLYRQNISLNVIFQLVVQWIVFVKNYISHIETAVKIHLSAAQEKKRIKKLKKLWFDKNGTLVFSYTQCHANHKSRQKARVRVLFLAFCVLRG